MEDKKEFSLLEVAEALLLRQGVKEGLWQIGVRFNFTALNAGPSDDKILPAALAAINSVQLTKVTERNALTVDASQIQGSGAAAAATERS